MPASIHSVSCATGCAGLAMARPGATIAVTGTGFDAVTQIVFLGGHAAGDDVTIPVGDHNATQADATVPAGAVSGRVAVINADGTMSSPSAHALRITAAPMPSGGAVHASLSATKVYYDGTDPATLRYFIDSAAPSVVTVTLVHGTAGKRVASWGPALVDGGTVGSVTWTGSSTSASSGVATQGRYTFRVTASSAGGGVRAASVDPAATMSFTFLPDVFPVSGKHTFNLKEGRFGAARNGHIHQGQDVMAKCGVPIVAARGGTIEKVDVDVNAGNYVVIDAAGTGVDMFYAHLREPSPLAEGDTVLSGPAEPSVALETRPPAICTSRSGRRRAGTRAATRSTRCPTCGAGGGRRGPRAPRARADARPRPSPSYFFLCFLALLGAGAGLSIGVGLVSFPDSSP